MQVCVVGNFGNGEKVSDGQRIKTVELYNALVNYYGEKLVGKINTNKKAKIRLVFSLVYNMIRSKNFIVLVSKNGRKTIIPLMVILNKLFRRRIFHSLIGSTTHETLEKYPKLIKYYNELSGNWSETSTEKDLLEAKGLSNVCVIKNFKKLNVLSQSDLNFVLKQPYRFCTFSRVEYLKGIQSVVDAVNAINGKYGSCVCTLDIYGQVMPDYIEEFEELKKEFGENISYKGIIDYEKSVDVLKDYYMVVFPTKYYTEGIPGTLLDAFSSGVPVISSEWESCHDVMTEKIGLVYAFNDDEALISTIDYAINNPEEVNKMKFECLKEAKNYSIEKVVSSIVKVIEGK